MANVPLKTIKFPGLDDTYTVPQVDSTLAVTGAAADAKKTGDEITDLKQALSEIEPGLSDDAKTALLNCFQHVAWTDEHGQDYYDALEYALYPRELVSISAVFNAQGTTIYTDDSLDSLKQYLTVTATYSDSTTAVVTDYTLSGSLIEGTSTITVYYDGKTTTFTISNVVDFYNVYHWNSALNTEIVYATGLIDSATYQEQNTVKVKPYSTSYPRLTFCANRGQCPFLDTYDEETEFYPIPIPVNATVVRVTWPNNYKIAIQQKKYQEQYIFGWVADSGWQSSGSYETQIVTSQTKGKADRLYLNIQKGNNEPIIGDNPTIDIQFS